MSGQEQPRVPAWLAPAVLVLLSLQLVLVYVQGFQIHRQRGDILQLRDEVRSLADSLDQGTSEDNSAAPEFAPARRHLARKAEPRRFAKAWILEEDPEPAQKDLDTAKKSADKAVKDAKEIQEKLSLAENARKAEEKARLQAEQNKWQKYVGLGLALGLVLVIVRSYLRRR
jgi:ElaB/YqjD/DUF883 family membrane-anchored ribosome-binding protein